MEKQGKVLTISVSEWEERKAKAKILKEESDKLFNDSDILTEKYLAETNNNLTEEMKKEIATMMKEAQEKIMEHHRLMMFTDEKDVTEIKFVK